MNTLMCDSLSGKAGVCMQITDVRIRRLDNGGKMKAVASVTFDSEFVVHDIKIVEGERGYFVAMPNKKVGDSYKDVAHPLCAETRRKISDEIFSRYMEVAGPVESTDQKK